MSVDELAVRTAGEPLRPLPFEIRPPLFVHRCLFCGDVRLLPRWQPAVRFCNAEHHRQWMALKAQDN